MKGIALGFKSNIALIILIGSIYILAWCMQDNLYFNWDVSWLMEASARLLAGGTYTHDFFENNPPLILYLYIPPVVLTKLFSLNIMISLRIYIYFLATLSLMICWVLSREIFSEKTLGVMKIFFISLTFVFLMLPLYEFGQREHLFVILTLPYLLLMTIRSSGREINRMNAFLLGLYAALGFFIKPFFLIPWGIIEIYFAWTRKSFKTWLRPEILGMLCLLLVYTTILLSRHRDYLDVVVPYAARWCFLTSAYPWQSLIFNPYVQFCAIPIVFFCLQYHANKQTKLSMILVLALVGNILSFLVQQTSWYYRMLPAYSMAIILLCLLVGLRLNISYRKRDYILMGVLGGLMAVFMAEYAMSIWTVIVFNPWAYYSFFTILLFFLTYVIFSIRSIPLGLFTLISLIAILIISHQVSSLIQQTLLLDHRFLLTTAMILFTYYFLVLRKLERRNEYLWTLVVAMLLFSFPAYVLSGFYIRFVMVKQGMENLITYIKVNANHQSVYFFTTDIKYVFPVLQYAGDVRSSSRFSHFFGLGGMIKQPYMSVRQDRKQRESDNQFLIEMVAEDLREKKPQYVFVDMSRNKLGFAVFHNIKGEIKKESIPFDYLNNFSRNEHFKDAWKHYHYVTTLVGAKSKLVDVDYNFQVYKRQS